jgi:hypothetical protein
MAKRVLTKEQAILFEDEFVKDANECEVKERRQMLKLYELEIWKSFGYKSWKKYYIERLKVRLFKKVSPGRAYKKINAAKVEQHLFGPDSKEVIPTDTLLVFYSNIDQSRWKDVWIKACERKKGLTPKNAYPKRKEVIKAAKKLYCYVEKDKKDKNDASAVNTDLQSNEKQPTKKTSSDFTSRHNVTEITKTHRSNKQKAAKLSDSPATVTNIDYRKEKKQLIRKICKKITSNNVDDAETKNAVKALRLMEDPSSRKIVKIAANRIIRFVKKHNKPKNEISGLLLETAAALMSTIESSDLPVKNK